MLVKLVATCKLVCSEAEKPRLLATMAKVNEACNWLAEKAFELKSADKIRLQKLHYAELRSRFGLGAQHAVRAISKVCEVYKRDRSKLPKFKPHGAIAFDQRTYTFKNGLDRVSLACLDGRVIVPTVIGPYFRARLEAKRGQADLVYRKGKLYLYVTVDVPDGSPIDPEGYLGVDLGIRNLATDSDGEHFSGAQVEAVRQRYHSLRRRLQAAGTKSARRHLKRMSGKEARFRQIENHHISKRIVSKAKGTGRGIAMEDLQGIRDRVTVRKGQRAQRMSWAFYQMRAFVAYKALAAGVPLVIVDPRNTSRTCLACGHIDKASRKSQSDFRCTACGFEAHADVVGARNISLRAAVNRPMASSEGSHGSKSQVQVPAAEGAVKSHALQGGDSLRPYLYASLISFGFHPVSSTSFRNAGAQSASLGASPAPSSIITNAAHSSQHIDPSGPAWWVTGRV